MDAEERRQVTVEWNDTDVGSVKTSVSTGFLKHSQTNARGVCCHPSGSTVVLSRAGSIGQPVGKVLRQFDIKPDTRVAICLEPSIELLVAIFGVLKAGAAYAPISPSTPKKRVQLLLEDTKAPILITKKEFTENGPHLSCRLILLDVHAADIEGQREEALVTRATPDNLAYVIYTSGSTGEPKG
jgi:non-ribosomal peptide synthetase component F